MIDNIRIALIADASAGAAARAVEPVRRRLPPEGAPDANASGAQQESADADSTAAAIERIAAFLRPHAALEFRLDSASERVIVSVIDAQSGEVLRQMPSEEALAISRSIDRLQGLLVDLET